jgi:hypothetical protein
VCLFAEVPTLYCNYSEEEGQQTRGETEADVWGNNFVFVNVAGMGQSVGPRSRD